MRIKKIASSGTVAVKNIEIHCDTPITLIAAHNRGGKTSMRDGVIHAFTGAHPKEKLKKNYPLLINQAGGNKVGYTYVDYDGNQRACITLPNGVHELTQPVPAALSYVLDPSLFGSITPDERRSFLFDLMNLRSDGEAVKKNLVLRGLSTDRIEQVMPFLKSSFAAAQRHAEENVKQARANWKATTGETYGDKKADGWTVSVPVVDTSIKEKTESELASVERDLEESIKNLGAMQASVNGVAHRDAERKRLRDLSDREDRIRKKLDIDRNSVQEWKIKIEETRKLSLGSKPGAVACKCPECDAELIFIEDGLMPRSGDLHGNEEAAASLPKYQDALELVEKSVANGERDLAVATAAREQLALMKNDIEPLKPSDIEDLKSKIAELRINKNKLIVEISNFVMQIQKAAEAKKTTDKAAGYHADVQAWDQIAKALAPDGIPGEMLGAALKPINERIEQSVERLGFPGDVRITDDMTIIEDDSKLYAFSSKATRLLIDSMIAEAISFVADIKFFMVDEFDLLDMPTRGKYLKWLVGMARAEEIESVIVFGTLKEKPESLPTDISVHWLVNGSVQDDVKVEAA